jgi:subtilisin family serine protease
VVGARYYTAGFGGPAAIKEQFPEEFISARDTDGHGSHTSSTAAGNFGVEVVIDGKDLGNASGMAPQARVAIYKVCWGRGEAGGCQTPDLVQGIEDAMADGVDVINYSISGSRTSMVDPVEAAFLFAADAGVFVSASAGNDGPGASTVAHNGPWVTTVAAGTHDRVFNASVTLGNGQTFAGAGLGAAVPSSPLVVSTAVGLAGADPTEVRLCFPGTLDPAKVTGTIVVCDRGVNPRTDKSLAVQQAGGVGMVLANVAPSSLNADIHFVPTVHVNETAGAAIKAYVAATASPTASLSEGVLEQGARAPFVASFSSRGPALAGQGDLLKPDIMAPGVDVLAAVAPVGHHGRDFDFISGTSMSSPHVAGLGALLRDAHPSWSPMAIKSALLTSASVRDNTGQPIATDTGGATNAFGYGSGQATPNAAVDPGLVYDSGISDWLRFLCGAGQLAPGSQICATFGRIDPSDLNTPNIAIGSLAGTQTVTRTVTNVAEKAGTYVAFVQEPAGVDVTVQPSRIRVREGEKATFQVTITRRSAAFNQYAFGSLTWSDGGGHNVRSQIAVRPVAVSAPANLRLSGTAGSTEIELTPGYTGTLNSSVAGLIPATVGTATLTDPDGNFPIGNPQPGPDAAKFTVTVPAGTTLARFATFDSDYPAGTDLDMFVYRGGTATLLGLSAGPTAEEIVNLNNPTAGTYDVYVDLFGLAAGETEANVQQFSWALGTAAAGNLTATPASQPVQLGEPATVTASWTGLTAGQRYLGRVVYSDGSATVGSTVLQVDA